MSPDLGHSTPPDADGTTRVAKASACDATRGVELAEDKARVADGSSRRRADGDGHAVPPDGAARHDVRRFVHDGSFGDAVDALCTSTAETATLRDMPAGPPLTSAEWQALLNRALKRARKLKPDSEAAAEDLVHRAVALVFRPDGPGFTERDPKLLLRAIRKKMWSQAGWDTQRFDPTGRSGEELDDDRFRDPQTNWRPGHIPDPQQLVLAKEKHELGMVRLAKLTERFKADQLASLLIDTSYEKEEAKAEALRRGYTESQINDARWRLRRYFAIILRAEQKS
jgi:hypothetical protein